VTPVPWEHLKNWEQLYWDRKPQYTSLQPSLFAIRDSINKRVTVTCMDITTLQVDAIVNAANNTLLGGGGVDGAIHAAAGPRLARDCAQLGGCPTGEAKITSGYNLPARHVIHTVGPQGEKEHDLRNTYRACLKLCLQHGLRTIAFPCISTGLYGYPAEAAAKVALSTVRQWLEKHQDDVDFIIFCTFSSKVLQLYTSLMPRYFPVQFPDRSMEELNSQGLSPLVDAQSPTTPVTT
jgi:O-acetyl-ADP-ribose deacetylase (regulator of RNase III)